MSIDEIRKNDLMHYGIIRRSGRYPWGSGENPYQRSMTFMDLVAKLRKEGMSNSMIAKGFGMTTDELISNITIANNVTKQADIAMAQRLKDKGMSNVAIGQRMKKPESTVRALLKQAEKEEENILMSTVDNLKKEIDRTGGYLDVGKATELHLGVSKNTLNAALSVLEEDGYHVHSIKTPQLGTTDNFTKIPVLVPPNTTYKELTNNRDKIHVPQIYSEDKGRTFNEYQPPRSLDSKRIAVRYAKDGGADRDGIIEIRPGVDDLSLGNSRYAQVRIMVDDTHYLKGVAVYSKNLPDGVDVIFNTNKDYTPGQDKKAVFKEISSEPENPFTAMTRPKTYIDKNGKEQRTVLNIVNEEGDWQEWSKNLSSQMLSKQSAQFAKEQLGLSYDIRKSEYDEIMSLTNPVVKAELLRSFSDKLDASAAKLEAVSLPRTSNHVIIPVQSLKDNEIYAPKYKNGEDIVLIRHPHGGIFEIPQLKVNNRNKEAKSLLGPAADAVGINPKVAHQLSGADFDGDTVLVIPNKGGKIKADSPLKQLENFDPRTRYPYYEGMKVMTNTQNEMGSISNLITDMTIQGANNNEIARAVRHSMVVIDAEKHKLNYKQSYLDNGIAELKKRYQGGVNRGASTLISRSDADVRVPHREPRKAKDGSPIDPNTGKKVFVETGRTYIDKNGKVRESTVKTKRMHEVDNAFDLVSTPGTVIESVYANHANRLKALANQARKEMVAQPRIKYSPSARQTYSNEVASLRAKLNTAQKNSPLERQAQLLAKIHVDARRNDNPSMSHAELSKIRGQELSKARERVGAGKILIRPTEKEWEAIQNGAVSNNFLQEILRNSDQTRIKELATPRTRPAVGPALLARAKSMLSSGYTQSEIADVLGISTTTLSKALSPKEKE